MVLSQFDLFSIEPKLLVNKNKNYSTGLSLFITLINCILMGLTLIYFANDLIFREHPKVISATINEEDSSITLINDNFFLAVSLIDPESSEMAEIEQIADISVQSITRTKGVEETISLPFKKCSELTGSPYLSLMKNIPLEKTICADFQSIELKGTTNSELRKTVKVAVKPCSSCESPNKLSKYVLKAYMPDLLVDPRNYRSPSSNYLLSKEISTEYTFGNKLLIRLSDSSICTDDYYFLHGSRTESMLVVESTEFNHAKLKGQNKAYGSEIILGMSQFQHFTSRSYMKIQEFAVIVGGIMKFLIVLSELTFGCLMELSYFLFIYDTISIKSFYRKDRKGLRNIREQPEENNVSLSRFNKFERQPTIKFNFDQKKLHRTVTCLDILSSKLCCKTKYGKSIQKIQGNNKTKVEMKMDLLSLFKLQSEFEAMKKLFLTKDQHKIVSFFNICNNCTKYTEASYLTNSDYNQLNDADKADIKESLTTLENSTNERDQQILNMIGYIKD